MYFHGPQTERKKDLYKARLVLQFINKTVEILQSKEKRI